MLILPYLSLYLTSLPVIKEACNIYYVTILYLVFMLVVFIGYTHMNALHCKMHQVLQILNQSVVNMSRDKMSLLVISTMLVIHTASLAGLERPYEKICWSRIIHGREKQLFCQKYTHTNFVVGEGEGNFPYFTIAVHFTYFESTVGCINNHPTTHCRDGYLSKEA